MTERPRVDIVNARQWIPARTFSEFARICCGPPHLNLLSDSDSFSVTFRVGEIGPITLSEVVVGTDTRIDSCEFCSTYRVLVPQSGHAVLYAPLGLRQARWAAGSKFISLKMNGCSVNDALSDALGREIRSRVHFNPIMPTDAHATRSRLTLLLLFREQLFRPDSVVNQPLVGLPFADCLVRGFVFAAEHSDRDAMMGETPRAAPRAIRTAVEIMEEEAHLPLTVSSIAARSYISVRALQKGFRDHLRMSPLEYLRRVRPASCVRQPARFRPVDGHRGRHRSPVGLHESEQVRRRAYRPLWRTARCHSAPVQGMSNAAGPANDQGAGPISSVAMPTDDHADSAAGRGGPSAFFVPTVTSSCHCRSHAARGARRSAAITSAGSSATSSSATTPVLPSSSPRDSPSTCFCGTVSNLLRRSGPRR